MPLRFEREGKKLFKNRKYLIAREYRKLTAGQLILGFV